MKNVFKNLFVLEMLSFRNFFPLFLQFLDSKDQVKLE